jgi:hypothetical protein
MSLPQFWTGVQNEDKELTIQNIDSFATFYLCLTELPSSLDKEQIPITSKYRHEEGYFENKYKF